MAKIEYRQVDHEDYIRYERNAISLLDKISLSLNKKKSGMVYSDIIEYFEENYNILFTFFDVDMFDGVDGLGETPPGAVWIKHKNVVKSQSFEFLDEELVERISGITIPSNKRTLIMINQSCNLQRLIFTILHELSHFYFHILDEEKKKCFISLSSEPLEGKYPPELLPFEDEANIIASILFCTNEKLEHMLIKKYPFKDMCRNLKMSAPAMHNRLLNYFEHNLGMNSFTALNRVWDFRKGKRNVIYLIKGLIEDKQKEEINLTNFLITSQAEYIDNTQDLLDLSVCSHCYHCRTPDLKYCPICGSKNILPTLSSFETLPKTYVERINRMKYTKIETDETGLPFKCPQCEYESLEGKFNYCPMCSIRIHNECLGSENNKFEEDFLGNMMERPIHERVQYGCGGYLDGGFRYCPHCGSETSYSKQNLLINWKEEKNAHDIFE